MPQANVLGMDAEVLYARSLTTFITSNFKKMWHARTITVVAHLPSMHKAQGSVFGTEKNTK
jgi:hypothetical protein